jgi:hypothetical protein
MQIVRPFANTVMRMDISSDEDISAMVNTNNEFFYKQFVEASSDEDSDDDSDVLQEAPSLLHDHNEAMLHQWKGSVPGQAKSLDHN